MNHHATPIPLPLLALWLVLAIAASLLRELRVLDVTWFPVLLAALLVVPVATFVLTYWKSPSYKEWVLHARVRRIILAQTWRIGGAVFLVLYAFERLPGIFAFPAGLGDIAAGALAGAAAHWWTSQSRTARLLFVAWNIFGILDLVVAVTLGVLASPLGPLAGNVTTLPMTTFPLSLIPTFVVPLFIIYHLTCLIHAGKVSSRESPD